MISLLNKVAPSRVNNFNLLRIFAAIQVVIGHSIEHLKIDNDFVIFVYDNFLRFFPGVPIFFFVSGFLIFWSYSRNTDRIKLFFRNRFLRIFPGLWVCVLVTVFLLLLFSSIDILRDNQFYLWLIAQFSFFQFYTPDLLRFWGVGTPNGSLWTIIVELQFYLIVPVVFYLFNRNKNYYFLFILLSITFNFLLNKYGLTLGTIGKLLAVSIFPYFYYFSFGVLFFIYYDNFKKIVSDKFLVWFLFYLVWSWLFNNVLGVNTYSYWITSPINLISDVILLFLVFSFAYTKGGISDKILGNNDISYGVYIYHMLVVNVFVELGCLNKLYYLLLVVIIVCVLAYLSWKFIEEPVLKLKNKR